MGGIWRFASDSTLFRIKWQLTSYHILIIEVIVRLQQKRDGFIYQIVVFGWGCQVFSWARRSKCSMFIVWYAMFLFLFSYLWFLFQHSLFCRNRFFLDTLQATILITSLILQRFIVWIESWTFHIDRLVFWEQVNSRGADQQLLLVLFLIKPDISCRQRPSNKLLIKKVGIYLALLPLDSSFIRRTRVARPRSHLIFQVLGQGWCLTPFSFVNYSSIHCLWYNSYVWAC